MMYANAFAILLIAALSAGCQNTLPERSLVFFTGTTVGVEASANPSSPEGPVKVVLGYKRAEGVLDPVYHSNGVQTALNTYDAYGSHPDHYSSPAGAMIPVDRYLKDAYSVIAKISGEADANAAASVNGKIAVGQWFATGKAAETLASQPGIAGAVSGSAEIANAAAVSQKTYALKLTGVPAADAWIALEFAYDTLKNSTNDSSAQKVATDLGSV